MTIRTLCKVIGNLLLLDANCWASKMSQPNLLDIVPDQLFQAHYISDIDQVQKKLQYEIERKREELRAMVG